MKVPTDPARSQIMSRIKGKNNKMEIRLRKALHQKGFRYRLYDGSLPGKPDIVFPGRKALIFVNGCFWHRHDCSLFRLPKSNADFWDEKLRKNAERDRRNLVALENMGWRHLTVWECAVRGIHQMGFEEVLDSTIHWLKGSGCLSLREKGCDYMSEESM